ncbi:MAG TPA: ROK family protein [Longimicrobiales bacterium]
MADSPADTSRPGPSLRLGVDLGGTKIEALALDSSGREVTRRRVATPRTYDATVEAVAGLVEGIEEELGARGTVGMGIPGALSPATGLVKNANSTWLIGRPLDVDLARRLDRPVRVMNDANCFALSEATDGAGAGAVSVFGVILGTGVGGGWVLNGACVQGGSRIAGEWGHNPLPWPEDDERPGPACYCGKRGCIETFCSGPGLERSHAESTGQTLSTRSIGEAAAAGDSAGRATLERYVGRLARGLASVINVVDPDVVVLGGGVSNLPGLPEAVEGALDAWVFSDEVTTRVVRHVHGDSSGVRGAAWLWPRSDG